MGTTSKSGVCGRVVSAVVGVALMTACVPAVALGLPADDEAALSSGDRIVAAGNVFADVGADDWFVMPVEHVQMLGIMKGYEDVVTGEQMFRPNDALKREDVACLLFNWLAPDEAQKWEPIVGSDYTGTLVVPNETDWTDVKDYQYYVPAVNWIAEAGLIKGYVGGDFGVGDNITREDFAVVLKRVLDERFSGAGMGSSSMFPTSAFKDYDLISPYAEPAMNWACSKGMYGGDNGVLAPQRAITRAEAAKLISLFYDSYC